MTTRNHRSTPEALTKDLEEARKILERSAQTNRNLFITFNSVLVLCLIVTDKILLLGSSTIKLPLLSAELPIWAFASIAPRWHWSPCILICCKIWVRIVTN